MHLADPNGVQFRAVTAADLAELAAFLSGVLSGDWSEAALRNLQQSDYLLHVLTLRMDGTEVIVGFAQSQQILDEGHLLDIAIVPAWQGRGLGKLLLDRLLAELARRGCASCLLEVRRSNTPAQRLYQGAGFSFDGVRKNYYPPARPGSVRSGAEPGQHQASSGRNQHEDALLYSLSLSAS